MDNEEPPIIIERDDIEFVEAHGPNSETYWDGPFALIVIIVVGILLLAGFFIWVKAQSVDKVEKPNSSISEIKEKP